MTDTRVQLSITHGGQARALAARNAIQIGRYFVFAQDTAVPRGWVAHAEKSARDGDAHKRVLPLMPDAVHLPGLTVTSRDRDIHRIGIAVTDRDLYRAEDDPVRVLIAMPNPPPGLTLVVEQAGQTLAERELELAGGVGVETLAALLPGEYTAKLVADGVAVGTPARFTVAAYTLAPLSAQLASHALDRAQSTLRFELAVESYQIPFERPLVVALVEGGVERDELVVAPEAPGAYRGSLPISGGDGPLRLRAYAEGDAGLVAEVAIPGSRARERDATVVSELGREYRFSMMPEPDALPVRGGYVTRGDALATPLSVADIVTDSRTLHASADIAELAVVTLDLCTARFSTARVGDVRAGDAVPVHTDAPLAMVFVGGFVDGRPFEGFTAFLRPSALSLQVAVPASVRPRDALDIDLSTSAANELSVVVCVRDERLTATDRPAPALGASMQSAMSAATADARGPGVTALDALMPPVDDIGSATGMDMALGFASSMPSGGALDMYAAAPSALMRKAGAETRVYHAAGEDAWAVGAAAAYPILSPAGQTSRVRESAAVIYVPGASPRAAKPPGPRRAERPEDAQTAAATPLRTTFPEILFYGVVRVRERAQIRVPVGDSLGAFVVEAFALDGADWVEARERVVVDQPVRADLELPPAVHPDDAVTGQVRIHARSGRARLSLTHDDQPVALRRLGPDDARDDGIARTPAVFAFDAAPGRYRAVVTDTDTGEADAVDVHVGEPGRFRSYSRELALLQAGDAITLDSADALTLRVLPAIEEPLDQLVTATAGYEHLCCEQTAAKILSAVFMYASTPEHAVARRRQAEEIILAGVARQAQMITPDRGFQMYPHDNFVSDHYSRLATRYLWNLEQLASLPELSPSLRRAAAQGVELADRAARAHGVQRVPHSIERAEDAYAAITAGGDARDALAYVHRAIDVAARAPRVPRHAVADRALLAYGAATLLVAGEIGPGVRLANTVTRQLNDAGALYSTVDSVAALALMLQLRSAGVVAGGGRARVNGRVMTVAEASNLGDSVESIEAIEGVVAVSVTRMLETDWSAFAAPFPVRVEFRSPDDDRADDRDDVRRFRKGDRATLTVSLPDGYQAGDLAHICLPPCMSWIQGGGKVMRFTLDFEGRDRVQVPVLVTGDIRGPQRFAVCVRNMFEEERAASPGVVTIDAA